MQNTNDRVTVLLKAIRGGKKDELIALLRKNYRSQFGINAYAKAISDYNAAIDMHLKDTNENLTLAYYATSGDIDIYTQALNNNTPVTFIADMSIDMTTKFAKALNCSVFLQAFGHIKDGVVKGVVTSHPDGRDDVGPCDFKASLPIANKLLEKSVMKTSSKLRHYIRSAVFCGTYINKVKNFIYPLALSEAWSEPGGLDTDSNLIETWSAVEYKHNEIIYANAPKGAPVLRDIAALMRSAITIGEAAPVGIPIASASLLEIMACLNQISFPAELKALIIAPYAQLRHPFEEYGCTFGNIIELEGGLALRDQLCKECGILRDKGQ